MIQRQYHQENPVKVIADYSRNYLQYGKVIEVYGLADWYLVEFPNGDKEYLHGSMLRIAVEEMKAS